MKYLVLLYCTALALNTGLAQTPTAEYTRLVSEAVAFYKAKDFQKSSALFSKAFHANGWKGIVSDRYNAACSWALAGNADSSFYQLQRIASKGNYTNYNHAVQDEDLVTLHGDPRWTMFIELVKKNKEKSEEGLDKKLVNTLDSMSMLDQKSRFALRNFRNANPTADFRDFELTMMRTDSLNFYLLQQIFSATGFPNYDLVGSNGSRNFWLLVQHQDLHPDFQEAVLTKMKIEAEKGKASKMDYAYLIDRVKVNTGQPQIYGTQMRVNATQTSYEPATCIDPPNLDNRRASVGLEPIQKYTDTMNSLNSGTLKKQ